MEMKIEAVHERDIDLLLIKELVNDTEVGRHNRKNYKALFGKPDIAITKYHVAIFCDSEFFHGKDWPELEQRIMRGSNSKFWYGKITRNMERDAEVNRELYGAGWTVLRFWGKDIERHLDECIKVVDETVFDIMIHGYDS